MQLPRTKLLKTPVLALILSAMLVVAVGCSAQQPSSPASSSQESSSPAEGPSEQGSASAPTTEQYNTALNPTNIVSTFIGEKFSDQKITNEDEALAAIKSVYDRIGADDTTELQINSVRPTETGTTYYIFNQVAGDVFVYGANVKVMVDKDGNATGLISSILPKVELAKAEDWEITKAQAEEIVVKQLESDGHAGMETVADATEQTIITIPNTTEKCQYAWVVYTDNFDTDSEMPYLAHYVDGTGEYLYALPINEPHNADALTGDKANFDFDKYDQNTWSGTVTLHDGTTKDIEVPVLVDKSDNSVILADGKRKILCADFAKFMYDDTLAPRLTNEISFDNVELLAYDTFIKVWDFYESIGWTGPDGEGTPTLLLMDYVNKNGEPEDNAFYKGRINGFQTFAFNRLNPDGENMDVIAHEFTHCVTSTTMTVNIYLNDMGAINEGMSDVMGNLVEMLVANKPESAWLIGDSSGVGTLRSMKDPHEHQQPEFRWDTYYSPSVATGTEMNDSGGVHDNSSMLNIISYKLDQAGMKPEEQFYFWMNVALAMSPRTDYEQMAQLLPWSMKQSGYSQYADALKKAIEEGGYASLTPPDSPPAGAGKVSITYDAPELNDAGFVLFAFIPEEGDGVITTWPAVGTNEATCYIPAGNYTCTANVGAANINDSTRYYYTNDGWKLKTDDSQSGDIVHVEEGKTLELSAQGLPTTQDAVGK